MSRIIYFLIIILIGFTACQRDKPSLRQKEISQDMKAWIQAQKQGSISAYENFINTYPSNDSLVKLAKKKIDSIVQEREWQKVRNTTSLDSLRQFCLKYPYSIHHTEALHLANRILQENLDKNYKEVIDFLIQISDANDPYRVFSRFASRNFCLVKSKQYEEHEPIRDTFYIKDKESFDKYLNVKLFNRCKDVFFEGELLKNYELQCNNEIFTIIFYLSCGDIKFNWVKNDNRLVLECLEVCQDMRF